MQVRRGTKHEASSFFFSPVPSSQLMMMDCAASTDCAAFVDVAAASPPLLSARFVSIPASATTYSCIKRAKRLSRKHCSTWERKSHHRRGRTQ